MLNDVSLASCHHFQILSAIIHNELRELRYKMLLKIISTQNLTEVSRMFVESKIFAPVELFWVFKRRRLR